MKVRTFRGPRSGWAGVAQGRTVLRGVWHLARRSWIGGPVLLAVAIALSLLLFPRDAGLLTELHFLPPAQETAAQKIAAFLGTWGDYPTYNLPLAIGLWLYGSWAKSRAFRRLAVVCFLGATLAGSFDDCFRLTLGRPRPDAHLPDGFYGLTSAFRSRFQSFPSGHAAAVFGTAAALLVMNRPLGLLATAFALAVVWSRMELYRHYPSDVAVGSLIGISIGLLVGWGAKLRRARPLPGMNPTPGLALGRPPL